MLDAADKQWIRDTMTGILAGLVEARPMPRLTVEQFAVAVDLNHDVVLRKIRCRQIPANLVYGTRPKYISPKALELFGVTPLEARARLEEHNLWPAQQPFEAQSPDKLFRLIRS